MKHSDIQIYHYCTHECIGVVRNQRNGGYRFFYNEQELFAIMRDPQACKWRIPRSRREAQAA